MTPRAIGPILTDVAAITNGTSQATIQGLRDELVPYLQGLGNPQQSPPWALAFAAASATKVTRMLVSGWFFEFKSDATAYAAIASIDYLT